MNPTNDPWPRIVEEALKEGLRVSSGAVPGARLRQLVASIAPRYDQQYPPRGREGEKFGEFLKSFSSLLILLRREGKDLLVAPADRPDLLTAERDGDYAFLREDIFEAFTRISREVPPKEAWYVRATDTIQWSSVSEPLNSTLFAKVPSATQNQEIEDRESFCLQPGMEYHKAALLETLGEHQALWAFSKVLKERGLGREWHAHRLKLIVKRIRSWCERQHVEWRDEWFRPSVPGAAGIANLGKASVASTDSRVLFARLIETLSEEDLQRISVPLDLVLKLLK